MNFYKALKHLHPDLELDKDFVLKDDGRGAYILEWDVNRLMPSDEEILQAWQQIKDIPEQHPLTELELIKKQQTDLVFELMMKGVL